MLRKYGPEVIGVTGSSGKTTTKEAIAAVLSTRHAAFKNPASYSGRYGLPIALGQLTPSHRIAVLELAVDTLNEIRDLAELTRPTVGVVTTVSQAHIQNLGSLAAIEREKGHLVRALPAHGTGDPQPRRPARVAHAPPDPGPRAQLWPAQERRLSGQPDRVHRARPALYAPSASTPSRARTLSTTSRCA